MASREDGGGSEYEAKPEIAASLTAESAAARAILDQVCILLLEPTPAHLDRSAELLAEAVKRVTACREEPPATISDRRQQTDDVRKLRTGLASARRLLEAAARFHAGWVGCAGALCAGYTRCGQPGVVAPHSRLWAQG